MSWNRNIRTKGRDKQEMKKKINDNKDKNEPQRRL